MRQFFLWLHVFCAALWILGSLALALGAFALDAEHQGLSEFTNRVLPRLNRLNLCLAGLLLVSGIANLTVQAMRRDYHFSTQFQAVLGAKFLLFGLMALAMRGEFKIEARLKSVKGGAPQAVAQVAWLAILTAAAGATAMGLGVWLAGS